MCGARDRGNEGRFAKNVAPIITEIQSSGTTGLQLGECTDPTLVARARDEPLRCMRIRSPITKA